MNKLKEKAQTYAEKIYKEYNSTDFSEISPEQMYEETENAYLQCSKDIMSMPILDRLTDEEKANIETIAKIDINGKNAVNWALRRIFGDEFFNGIRK